MHNRLQQRQRVFAGGLIEDDLEQRAAPRAGDDIGDERMGGTIPAILHPFLTNMGFFIVVDSQAEQQRAIAASTWQRARERGFIVIGIGRNDDIASCSCSIAARQAVVVHRSIFSAGGRNLVLVLHLDHEGTRIQRYAVTIAVNREDEAAEIEVDQGVLADVVIELAIELEHGLAIDDFEGEELGIVVGVAREHSALRLDENLIAIRGVRAEGRFGKRPDLEAAILVLPVGTKLSKGGDVELDLSRDQIPSRPAMPDLQVIDLHERVRLKRLDFQPSKFLAVQKVRRGQQGRQGNPVRGGARHGHGHRGHEVSIGIISGNLDNHRLVRTGDADFQATEEEGIIVIRGTDDDSLVGRAIGGSEMAI